MEYFVLRVDLYWSRQGFFSLKEFGEGGGGAEKPPPKAPSPLFSYYPTNCNLAVDGDL